MNTTGVKIIHLFRSALRCNGITKLLLAPMMLSFLLAGVSMSLPQQTEAAGPIEITVQTTECSGDIGFSSFSSRDLYKIQSADCNDPNEPGKKLQQVLLKSDSGLTRYNVLWVTQDEAKGVMQQIKEGRAAKIKRLTRPDVVIKKETTIKQQRPPVRDDYRSSNGGAPTTAVRGEMAGPTISIIDPPVANTRSITNVITPAGVEGRLLVGKVDAPAGLLSLTIKGQPNEVDPQGLFKTTVPVSKSKTPVTVVAVDKQGKRSTVEFRLLTEILQQEVAKGEAGAVPDAGLFGKYHALVIANNQYQKLDDLSTPINDADAIAEILKSKYGFAVTQLYNVTRYEMLSAMNAMRRDLTEKDNLLIYYAGHGEYDKTNNRGHWLPVDAEHDSTANWVSTIAITDIVNATSAKHVLIVADSCYSGALTRSASTELDPGMSEEVRMKWLRVIAKTRSRYVLTSGGVKPVLDDGGDGHSMFANALIKSLKENQGVLEGSKLYRQVKSLTAARAEELNVEQVPQYAKLKRTGHEYGEFLLVGKK